MNNTTYSYTANDFAGNIISRYDLTFRQLATHVSNLVVSGYKLSIWDSAGNDITVEQVPASWYIAKMTDAEIDTMAARLFEEVTA